MNQWQQHYYTWSTNSLSGNKVGLGIVAASIESDRAYMRIIENQGARSEVVREEESLTIERFSYSEDLPGYIRSGATPCASGADKRNNKFVHIYSLKEEKSLAPEDYLIPFEFKKEWTGEQELAVFEKKEAGKNGGREIALKILEELGLSRRFEELFCAVYRCLLAGEKPLSITAPGKSPEEFATFSRQMMILIHYMIPKSLRREADYVSYVKGDSQEAHFLFRREGGSPVFALNGTGSSKKEYALLEKEFYKKLADAFLKKDSSFEKLMEALDAFLHKLSDKRNQLEKCIFVFMAQEASKASDKAAYFTGVERLMYWARKDESLLPALKDATRDLDFHAMEEEELLNYTNLLLTGAGGKTKELAYDALNRMLRYFYKSQSEKFDPILDRICKKNHSVYEQLLKENEQNDSFTKTVLYQPIESKVQLEEAIKNHESFLKEEDYRYYVAQSAYQLYQKAKSRAKRQEIEALGKQADGKVFLSLKQKDVEKVLKKAQNLNDFFAITDQMDFSDLEPVICQFVMDLAISLFQKDYPELLPDLSPKMQLRDKYKDKSGKEQEYDVKKLLFLGEKLSMEEQVKTALSDYYTALLSPIVEKMSPRQLIGISFFKQSDDARADFCEKALETLALERYLNLLSARKKEFYALSPKEWIRFALKITNSQDKKEQKKEKEAISKTKQAVLEKEDLLFLEKTNQALKNHGVTGISCPKKLWDGYSLGDFKSFYEDGVDISLIPCDSSLIFLSMEILYHFADQKIGKEERKHFQTIAKKDEALSKELLYMLAVLWGSNEKLDLDFVYSLLLQYFDETEAKKQLEDAAKE
ncbi:MAG: hypothetical protein Q4B70_08880, partial [Lachnospiraceae bacterium]|nr:hypothetical protein [Lachnospiraceae bacterium]